MQTSTSKKPMTREADIRSACIAEEPTWKVAMMLASLCGAVSGFVACVLHVGHSILWGVCNQLTPILPMYR